MQPKYSYIIADHIRASCFLIGDGVKPSGKGQGYILRRLLRRSFAASHSLNIDVVNTNFIPDLVNQVAATYHSVYPEIEQNTTLIISLIQQEAQKYQKSIGVGNKEWTKILTKQPNLSSSELSKITFDLYQTHGVPLELSLDIIKQHNVHLDEIQLHKFIEEHQKQSQQASTTQFKGGLASHNEQTTKLHTATHILHQVLRAKFGTEVKQMGSAIKTEKARFDFAFDRRLEDEEIQDLESKVQAIIDRKLVMKQQELTLKEAQNLGAIGLFGEKYGEIVSVYSLHDEHGEAFSREFCGGPHVTSTANMGQFKILKQKSVGQGVKRLEFTLT